MNSQYIITQKAALEKLRESPQPFATLLRRDTLEIEIYKPIGEDKQQPHTRDELYVILNGTSLFYHEGNTTKVKAGDCLFVPAYDEHRFVNFSDEFSTWVFFFGPEGREQE